MSKERGVFLCLEGGDGSGKGTQYELLCNRLRAEDAAVETFDFPRYNENSSELVRLYLNNEFGEASKLDSRIASAFFAIDRRAATDEIRNALDMGSIVLANRFSASNMAHQGAKITNSEERIEFFNWVYRLEHEDLGIPFPNYHIVLGLPAEVAQQRVLKKAERTYTDKKLDGHEADIDFLRRSEKTYRELVSTFPKNFVIVECVTPEGYEKTVEEVHSEVWETVSRIVQR